ncbi:hypothetical protein BASA50_010342 [Batrachochytrium salamandrivorans]|uniref:Acyl-CoA thioesterase 2 C-terminal domain-containing protein n=1 Tax=Batrachochytrium salamandrivorans TaxID=1357716 RepID=A0ABQ8EYS7_9FUNG|nr:hypothetical protein BASA60_010634 [Batrachochytrium salamandrivorans]KAH6567318.1 hypothetical protein BASA62_006141 [Batrachochytrium salamandrivorans]KAH6588986.1 hypothetical protein BASA50_010342 [Batrachochytrium salamandrivorans]KAH9267733.1 acyl-CoA thioesterase II [Batrachochytrium salamandrivorans]
MPNVPPPESCKSTHQRLLDWLDNPRASKYHKTIQMKLEQPIPIDTRPVGHRRLNLDPAEPCQMIWMKAIGRLPDNLAFHHCVAAYCSDHELLTTSLIPHGLAHVGEHRRLTMLTSLDHAIWFHAPFRADEWLLYVMESTRAIGGRGYVHGRIYTQDGRLVMSTAQEGVIRARVLPPKLTSKASSADDETDIKSSQSGLAKL